MCSQRPPYKGEQWRYLSCDSRMRRLDQGEFCDTFSPLNPPVLKIEPGETVSVSFPDGVGGAVKTGNDRMPFLMNSSRSQVRWNPTAGPIYVEGAEKGDTLSVKVQDITIDAEQGRAILRPPFDLAFTLLEPPDYKVKICPIRSGRISFKDGIEVPVTPSIGCIGTAPSYGAIPTSDAGRHGGNIDVPEIRKGSTIYLPVFVRGGLLQIGDAHAWQPQGELTAVDVPATVTLTIELINNKQINWPRIESEEYLMSINTSSPIERAIHTGLAEISLWLGE